MRRHLSALTAFLAIAAGLTAAGASAGGQYSPGGQGGGMGGMGGAGRPGSGSMGGPGSEVSSSPVSDKPEVAAKKAYAAGMKAFDKAQGLETLAAKTPDPDKKSVSLEKAGDLYNRALDLFTEALSNKGDMVEAWDHVGFVHLKLGANMESIDDYNHALALKSDLPDATLHRAVAYVHVDRLDEAKAAYMDLFNHERSLADELMVAMQQWLSDHRTNLNGMRANDVDAFDKWLQERDGIARQAASLPR